MSLLQKFHKDQSGAVAVIAALLIIPIILFAGAAFDFSRATNARTALQTLADGGVLAAGIARRDGHNNPQQVAQEYLNAHNYLRHVDGTPTVALTPVDDSTLKLTITGSVKTTLMALAGRSTMPIAVEAVVVQGVGGSLEIAMVLDNTGSMSGNKISVLRTAATNLVDTVEPFNDNNIKYALAPFAQYVNVGTNNRNQNWMDVPNDYSEQRSSCWWHRPVIRQYNCRWRTYTSWNDGVPTTRRYRHCDREYGPRERRCNTYTRWYRWYGCVGSRNHPQNVRADYGNVRFPGLMNIGCSRAVTPLTSSASTIKSAITRMNSSGSTYIPAGLAWGWRLLTPGAPFNQGAPFDPSGDNIKPRKVLILMTDGENTKSPNFPRHDWNDSATSDGYTTELCTAIKAQNIEVYTIAFEITDNNIKTLMRNCATDPDHYYDATNAASLNTAFSEIAASLIRLRLAK